ncbi:fatty acid--CoA ligase [Pseudonocardia petroleophila]|uniref:Long-chain-fatty-acid--CoA ligase n=1 Tax=Pseudonocardia petroleophila TaxID=37331 RepID=A0A7G7MDB5_9PSEU|nr:long-chain-fatty-acid--CoA ligase [Pseudonocardia petroleophila]QNG50776.1 long-chain-fatty-acid--CoA ligase [Pseudonocardia petroleophila]
MTLGALLSSLASDRPAITCNGRTITFAELDARASQVAHALVRDGVRPGDRVAVLTRNRTEWFELLFGAARAGAVLVGLNWRLAPPEIAAIAADAAPALVLAGSAERALLPSGFRVVDLDSDHEAWIAGLPTTPPAVPVAADDVVLQLYSSGTTGLPKGARLTHANLLFTPRMGATAYGMSAASVNLLASPLFHIGGTGYGLTTLGLGGHTILMSEVVPSAIAAAIEEHGVTHAFFVPAVVQMLLDAPPGPDLSSLQVIAYGGAPMTEALLKRAIGVLGCAFLGVYGMTETAGSVTALAPADHDRPELLRSVGRALPWHEVAVFDPVTGDPSPVGEVGEIRVRSGQNTVGYWNRPAETAATLTADGWLCTGDAAYADADGYLFLHDRIKDMIISGGENIYPAEVENAVAGAPGVADVAVIGVPSERWGETVKAVVVPADGATPTAEDVIAYARTRLARYKCPTSVDFVDALPRNASGKILKRTLRAPYWP